MYNCSGRILMKDENGDPVEVLIHNSFESGPAGGDSRHVHIGSTRDDTREYAVVTSGAVSGNSEVTATVYQLFQDPDGFEIFLIGKDVVRFLSLEGGEVS